MFDEEMHPDPEIQVFRETGVRYCTCRFGDMFMVFDQTDNIPVGQPFKLRLEAEFWSNQKNLYGPFTVRALRRVQHQLNRADTEKMTMYLLQYMETGSLEALASLGAAATVVLSQELEGRE